MILLQWSLFLVFGRLASTYSLSRPLIQELNNTFQILRWNKVLIASKTFPPYVMKTLIQRNQIASKTAFNSVEGTRLIEHKNVNRTNILKLSNVFLLFHRNIVIDCDSMGHDDLPQIFSHLTNHVPYSTLFVEQTRNSCNTFINYFSNQTILVGHYTLFYISSNTWRLALTLSSGNGHVSHQDLDQNPFPNEVNLQGAHIKTIGMTWKPWMTVSRCNREGHINCETAGASSQVMGLLGHLLNFTWSLDRDPDGDWGTVPKTLTWMDKNATFSGVLGGAVSKRYEVLMPIWARRYERSFWIDFADSMYSREIILVIKANQVSLDFTLFIRPFTISSWLLIIGVLVTLAIILYAFRNMKNAVLSRRVIVMSGWMFFVLLNSFYGGALTMFFSSAPKAPFQTISEGLRSFPDWQLLQIQGDEVLIQPLAEAGIPEFKNYWENVIVKNPELLVPDVETAVNRLLNGNHYFLFTSKVTFSQIIRADPSLEDQVEILGTPMRLEACFGLRKHSPLRPLLNDAIMKTKQSGVLTKVVDKWIDIVSERSTDSLEPQIVTLKQIGLVFGLSLGILILVTAIFFVELAWHRYSRPGLSRIDFRASKNLPICGTISGKC